LEPGSSDSRNITPAFAQTFVLSTLTTRAMSVESATPAVDVHRYANASAVPQMSVPLEVRA
jgi:hypothetical protein